MSKRIFLRAFFAAALPYGLSNDSSKIRFPFFGVWFPSRGGWLAYLCLFAGQNAAAHAANLAFGELLNHYVGHKEKRDKKQQPQQFSISSQKPLLLDRNLMGENKKIFFYTTHAGSYHTFCHQKRTLKTLFRIPTNLRALETRELRHYQIIWLLCK